MISAGVRNARCARCRHIWLLPPPQRAPDIPVCSDKDLAEQNRQMSKSDVEEHEATAAKTLSGALLWRVVRALFWFLVSASAAWIAVQVLLLIYDLFRYVSA